MSKERWYDLSYVIFRVIAAIFYPHRYSGAENVPEGKLLADYRFGDTAYAYLDKITALCKENDIQLVLVKARFPVNSFFRALIASFIS